MTAPNLSRRAFLGRTAAAPAAALSGTRPTLPATGRAWIIVELGWEYNDEAAWPEGQYPRTVIYRDKEEAEAECRRLQEAFFARQTPQEFEVDVASWDCDPETATWEELIAAGFPEPYYVQEMQL